jgi:hypothetical protein
MPVVTMDGERSLSHKITQFVYRAHNSISSQLVSGMWSSSKNSE